jgi:hypothetical protein
MSRGDTHVISGIDAILNTENVKNGINLRDLSERMISDGLIGEMPKDPTDRFNDELKDAAQRLGIAFDEQPAKFKNVSIDGQARAPPSEAWPKTSVGSVPESVSNNAPDDLGLRREIDVPRLKLGPDMKIHTEEQERRSHIESVIGSNDSGTNFSFEKEKKEDMKCQMLAEIDQLTGALLEEDVDLTRIPEVSKNSTYSEVETVLKMLRHKNDHTRYCSFAEEFLLFGAYALEDLFDGKRTWFGRYNPDLGGWHNHVNVKLKRMKHDTGQVVSDIMRDYNIGPTARIILELVPNMILYSKMKTEQHGMGGLYTDTELTNATEHIRSL